MLGFEGPGVRRLRLWLYASFGLLFVVAMALAGPLAAEVPGSSDPAPDVVLRVAVVALALPVVMAFLARRVLAAAASLPRALPGAPPVEFAPVLAEALVDPLSGLGNHRAFQEELARQIELSRQHRYALAVVLADIDDMKRANDERGPAAADRLLAEMGRLTRAFCRKSDSGFRIGGDEFAILLPRADLGTADGVARRLLAAALNSEATRPNAETFSFSAGVAAYPTTTEDGRSLLHQAEAALAWAKQHGRTDVQAYDSARHGAGADRRLASDLTDALATVIGDRKVVATYQTIYDLESGRPLGIEGLARPDDESGFADARSMFMAAEAAGRTVELDGVCMEAIAAGAQLPDASAYLAFNVSPRTIETEQFRLSDLLATLASHGVSPSQTVLELTEREPVEDMDRLRSNLEHCQAEGIRIAADDVSAGSAGLRLLSEIRFDIVKIDLSVVRGGILRESGMAVLCAIRDVGLHSGATVVAEGIDTADQLEVVHALGLKAGQGYLLSPPGPEAHPGTLDLKALLAAHDARRKAMGPWFDLEVA